MFSNERFTDIDIEKLDARELQELSVKLSVRLREMFDSEPDNAESEEHEAWEDEHEELEDLIDDIFDRLDELE